MSGSPTHTIGKYRLLAELGRGGMSKVFVAVASGPAGFNKLAVLKILSEGLSQYPEFVTMFLDEARLAARLNHANVVQTNEVGSDGDRYFIAMEFLEGQPLHRVLKRAAMASEKMPLDLFLMVVRKTLDGLHAAHSAKDFSGTPLNIVHRDASPQNVFVTYDGQVKIVDFGIARANGRASETTRVGVLKGKVVYMPPEQVQGVAVDGRADLFAVGVALFDFLAGRRMWDGQSEVEIVAKLLRHDYPRSPRAAMPDVPEALDAICRKALAPDPSDRYANARAMQADVEAFLAERKSAATERQLGDYVAKLFECDRTEIDAVIQTQLKKLTDLRISDGPLPVFGKAATTTITSTWPTDTQVASGVSVAPPPQRKSRLIVGLAAIAVLLVVAVAIIVRPPPQRVEPTREAAREIAAVGTAVPPAAAQPLVPAQPSATTSVAVAPPAPPAPVASSGVVASRSLQRAPMVAAPPAPPRAAVAPVVPAATSTMPEAVPPPRSTRPDLGY
jgi:eukaryotic-like serine/threonine-protein kinase